MCRAYLRSDVFYSFWFRPSSKQHPAFEMYVCGVLFVSLFIVFACVLVWNVLVNQNGFLYITTASVCSAFWLVKNILSRDYSLLRRPVSDLKWLIDCSVFFYHYEEFMNHNKIWTKTFKLSWNFFLDIKFLGNGLWYN